MGLHSRWPMLHSELFRFVSLLPDAAELAIVTFGAEAELVLTPTLLTQDNREGIYGRIPRRHLEEETSCLKCAVDLGLKTLGGSAANVNGLGGTLILITASAAQPATFKQTLAMTQASKNQIHVVAFEKSIFYEARHLVGESGTTYIVHEKHHDVIAGALNISDIFTAILKQTGKVQVEKFHEEQKISDEKTSTVTGNFVVEENLRDNLWVQIAAPDEDDIEMFELTNPAGRVFEFPKYEHGLVYFKLAGTQEAGIWSYRARLFKKDQNIRVSVQVKTFYKHF